MIKEFYNFLNNLDLPNNVIGLSRSLLAVSGLSIFLFNDMSVILFNGSPRGIVMLPKEMILNELNVFSIFPEKYYFFSWLLCVLILVLVLIGWRPRITALPHCWLLYSFFHYTMIPNGGDQIALVLSLLLLPINLLDNRKWHWQRATCVSRDFKVIYNLFLLFFLILIKLQVSALYLEAATSKFQVEEWVNGTAVYYWFTNPMFGASGWVLSFLKPILGNSYGVTLLTWGAIFIELLLFMGIGMKKKYKFYLLFVGISFHFGILLIHGLVSFFFSITAALVLYLVPINYNLDFVLLKFKKNFILK